MDKYDKQIARLTKQPEIILSEWTRGQDLFKVVGDITDLYSGCLTMIRGSNFHRKAYVKGIIDEKLTEEIRADERLPKSGRNVRLTHLPIFAEWQRRIDKMNE